MFHYNFFSWILVLKMRKIDKEIQSTKQLGELKKYSNCNLYSGPRAGDCQLWKWEWLTLRNNFGGKHCHRTHFCLTHRQNYTTGHNTVLNNTAKGYKMHQYDKIQNKSTRQATTIYIQTKAFIIRYLQSSNSSSLHGTSSKYLHTMQLLWFTGLGSIYLPPRLWELNASRSFVLWSWDRLKLY